MTKPTPLRIAVTPGEPAGIGPDLLIEIAQRTRAAELVAIGDPDLLLARSKLLNLPLDIIEYREDREAAAGRAGQLVVAPVRLAAEVTPGSPDVANGACVAETLHRAAAGCLRREFAAMVTGPVQKSVIAAAGIPFSGHTEFLADICGVAQPAMLLCASELRVALVTTHLALRDVPAQITTAKIHAVASVLATGLRDLFGIDRPRIGILGLNPHAGEYGQLGDEEVRVIAPAIARLAADGLAVSGPLPADSAFTRDSLANYDAILAMFHDQGLPVLKHSSFGAAINVTLGLPIIRTSVDHGTALELAGTGNANAASLALAVDSAVEFARRRADADE